MPDKEWRTITGPRPDLAQIEVNPVFGYIGHRLYPREAKTERVGDFTYQTVVQDVEASTSYSDGAALSVTNLGMSEGSWTCRGIASRYGITKKEVYNFGNIERADYAGATGAKRAVMNKIESRQLAKLCTGSSTELVDGEIFTKLQKALDTIKRYPGRKAVVMNFSTFRALTQTAEFRGRLVYNGWTRTAEEVLGLGADLVRDYLSRILIVDEVLLADDQFMADDYIVVAALPSEEDFSYKDRPELGKTFVFIPDGGELFDLETDVDFEHRQNLYTAESFCDIVENNSGAKVIFTLAADESSSSGDESSSSSAQA